MLGRTDKSSKLPIAMSKWTTQVQYLQSPERPHSQSPDGRARLEYVQTGQCSRSIQVTRCCCPCAICCRMSS